MTLSSKHIATYSGLPLRTIAVYSALFVASPINLRSKIISQNLKLPSEIARIKISRVEGPASVINESFSVTMQGGSMNGWIYHCIRVDVAPVVDSGSQVVPWLLLRVIRPFYGY
ncbi:hypothetical protein HKBW3S43_01638 [Candidatus Hakubella thermalkaliphila]|uniref:Uncharacterized protein n=1 Tax=Candidatus Hakubella thermalkaliphila TaxID=2754717 RepID=A0A6V8PYT4_9ACTN|nr:hypothetical protein HKBW3S33_00880 [Candidatus Hakubella thermalkaliphila]GFP35851.1 hypothetical protein HKBW3S43_01638 [Candidatus Hakubella thermalkaliphila]